jgi:hypothetical protein
MTDKDKENEIKIVFDPGCFDNIDFESQEELDGLINSIREMFEGKSREEIEAMSRPVDMDELLDEDPELAEALIKQLNDIDKPRNLQ